MASSNARPTLTELLLQPTVIEQLRERFAVIQDSLTTTINEASTLTGLSEAQLRYAESRGMLSPNRAAKMRPIGPGARGQRRYTADNLLRAHLIAFLLDQGYSLAEVSTYIDNNSSVIQDVLQTNVLRLRSVLDCADEIQFHRYFIPRALYYAFSLIFERDAVTDVGLIIPVRASIEELAEMTPGPIETADDLSRLGHTFVAWCARGRPVSVFMTAGNPFDHDESVRLAPFAALLADDPWRSLTDAPAHTYIAYGPHVEPELLEARRLLTMRLQRDNPGETNDTGPANPRVVAGRLVQYVQSLCCYQFAVGGQSEAGLGSALLYTEPELVNPALGDALLSRLANTIVSLGGMSRERPQEQRWRFSCVLTPREPNASLKQQELVVRAQSTLGPHRIGVTTTSPKLNGGLTFRAFSSGRVTYRPEIIAEDPAVSYVREERPIKSAIAAPAVEGPNIVYTQPPAVVYVTSPESHAFDANDFLLMRVMGRLVGELVQTYNSRGHQPNTLTDTLANPEIVDVYFAEFLSDLNYVRDLSKILGTFVAKPRDQDDDSLTSTKPRDQDDDSFTSGIETLTLVGLDVNDLASIQRRMGDRVARMLIREVGSRTQQRMSSAFAHGAPTARLYRAWGDRFYLLVRNERNTVAREHAERIREDISGLYQLVGDTIKSVRRPSSSPLAGADSIFVGVRMAGMTLSKEELATLLSNAESNVNTCAASLTRLLDDGLKQANETPDPDHRSLWWDSRRKSFEQVRLTEDDLTPAMPAEAAQLDSVD